jgi:Kef-type K+ transport system membrane component KefB
VIRTANETGEIALVCGHDALAVGLSGLGWVTSDLPVQVLSLVGLAFLLSATALGLVAPILKDAGESECEFGQLVLAAATIADLGTVILLSLLFSGNAGSVGSRLALLGSF